MNLIQVIGELKTDEQAKKFIAAALPGVEFDYIDIYLVDKPDLYSEVKFFDVDTVPNNLEIVVDGIKYINLFPLVMLQEMVSDYIALKDDKLSNEEIAKRILD